MLLNYHPSVLAQQITATGIASAEAFGTLTVQRGNVNLQTTGIPAPPAFGNMLTGDRVSSEGSLQYVQNQGSPTVVRTSAQAFHGTWSISLTSTNVGTSNMDLLMSGNNSVRVPVAEGQQVTTMAAFRAASTTRTCRAGLHYYNSGGGFVSSAGGGDVTDSNSAWTQSAFTTTVPIGTGITHASPNPIIVSVVGAGEVHYIDALGIYDGTRAAAEWSAPSELDLTIYPAPASTGEIFGTAGITRSGDVAVPGIPSDEAYGTATIKLYVSPTGIASGETFGTGDIVSYVAYPVGIPAVDAFSGNLLTENASDFEAYPDAWTWNGLASIGRSDVNGFRISGVSQSYLSMPDSASISFTGDMDVRVRLSMDDWTPTGFYGIISKDGNAPNQGWWFRINNGGSGTLQVGFSVTGSDSYVWTPSSSVATGFADGSIHWVRFTLDADNGSTAKDVRFYTSEDGVSWAQLGSTQNQAGTITLVDNTSAMAIGYVHSFSHPMIGTVYNAEVRNGIDGTVVAAFDSSKVVVTGVRTPSTFSQSFNHFTTTQANFDSSVTGWEQLTNCTIAHAPAVGLFGPGAMAVTATASVTMTARTVYSGSKFAVTEGNTYTAMAHFMADTTGRSVRVFINWLGVGPGFAFIGSSAPSTVIDTTTGWTQSIITDVAPAGALWAVVYTEYISPVVGEIHYVDGAGLFDGTVANWKPGRTIAPSSSGGFAWTAGGTFWSWVPNSPVDSISLPGTVGNYISTPDSAALSLQGTGTGLRLTGFGSTNATTPDSAPLSITGDIDIRVKLSTEDWQQNQRGLVAKYTAGQLSYRFELTVNSIILYTSNNGVAETSAQSTSLGFAPGAIKWVRATKDVDDGAGNKVTSFYQSDDGTNWTLINTVTQAGTTSIFDGTAVVEIGSMFAGSLNFKGTIYKVEIRNGINGTIVSNPDFEAAPWVVGDQSGAARSSGGQTWTLGGQAEIVAAAERRSLRLDGTVGAYVGTPDAVALGFPGDIDIRIYLAMDDWTSDQDLISKWASGAGQRSWALYMQSANGRPVFAYTTDGTTTVFRSATAAPTVTDGSALWLRVTCDVDNGATGHDTIFYTSVDGSTWTQLGTTVTSAGVIAIFDGTSPVQVGNAVVAGFRLIGNVFKAEVRNGINGTVVASPDFTMRPWDVGETNTATGVDSAGNTWTLNGVGSVIQRAFASDLDIRCKAGLDTWFPTGSSQTLASKWNGSTGYSWLFAINTSGGLQLGLGSAGGAASATSFTSSSVTPGFADRSTNWVRFTWRASDGRVQFFTSDNGVDWAQLGSDRSQPRFALYDGTAPVDIGRDGNNSAFLAGSMYYVEIRNGIDGTVVGYFDATLVSPTGQQLPITATQSGTVWTVNGTMWKWNYGTGALAASATATDQLNPATSFTKKIPITPGATYSAQAYFMATTNTRSCRVQFMWHDIADAYISGSTGSNVTDSTTAWTRATLTATAPSTAYWMQLWAPVISPVVIGENHYIDNVAISAGTVADYSAPAVNGITITGTGIPTAEAYGTSQLNRTINPTGLPSDWAFGNMLTPNQASVEVDTTGLTGNTNFASLARVTTQFSHVSASLQATTAASPSNQSFKNQPSTEIVVEPGRTYSGLVSIMTNQSGRAGRVQLNWRDSGAVIINSTNGSQIGLTSGVWTDLAISGVAPPTAVYVTLECVAEIIGGAGELFYFDKLGVYQGTRTAGQWDMPTPSVMPNIGSVTVPEIDHFSGNLLTNQQASFEAYQPGRWSPYGSSSLVSYVKTGGLRLPGTTGNYMSTPDSAAISITGDIDIRVWVQVDTLTGPHDLVAKFNSTANQRSYMFQIHSDLLKFYWSPDGSTSLSAFSTVTISSLSGAFGSPVAEPVWFRATLDVDNGASGRTVNFYYSLDGLSWSAFGSPVTTGGVTSIQDNGQALLIGDKADLNEFTSGTVYYAEVRSGIGGPIAAAYDYNKALPLITDTRAPATLAVEPANLLTANQASIETDATGWANHTNATIARQTSFALHGAAGLSITAIGTGVTRAVINGRPNVISGRSYTAQAWYRAATAGRSVTTTIEWRDGSGNITGSEASAGGTDTTGSWTQITATGVAPPLATSANLVLRIEDGSVGAGEVHYVDQIGFFESSSAVVWNLPGTVWTVNGSQWGYVPAWNTATGWRSRGGSTYISAPDSVPLSVTGDIDLRAKISMDDWAVAGTYGVVGKWTSTLTPATSSYLLTTGGGVLNLYASDGTTATNAPMASSTLAADAKCYAGAIKWVRVTRRVSDGRVQFFWSDDGMYWIQLGPDRTLLSGLSHADTATAVNIGAYNNGSGTWPGCVYYAEIRNGIDGTVVGKFDASEVTPTTAQLPTTYVSGSNTWTVNGTAWAWDNELRGSQGSLALTSNAAQSYSAATSSLIPVVAGNSYTTIAHFRPALQTRNVYVQFEWFNAAFGYISSTFGTQVSEVISKWVRATVTATPPATAAYCAVTPAVLGSPSAGEIHFVDQVGLYPGTPPTWLAPTASMVNTEYATGIASGEAFGTAQTNQVIYPVALGDTSAFGTAQINRTVPMVGIPSAEAFGTASVGYVISPPGIASASAFGTLQVNRTLPVQGIPSDDSFGNLLAPNQASFEVDTLGWSALNAGNMTFTRSTAQSLHGASSGAVVITNANLKAEGAATAVAVEPGRTYQAVWSIRAASTSFSWQVGIWWQDAGGVDVSFSQVASATAISGSWTQGTGTATAPSTAVKARVGLSTGNSPTIAAGATFYLDQAGLYPGTGNTWSAGTQVNLNATTVGIPSAEIFGGNRLSTQQSSLEDGTLTSWGFFPSSSVALRNTAAQPTQGVYLPGINTNFITTPDSVVTSITGDIDIRVKVALDDWTVTGRYFVYKRAGNTGYGLRTHSSQAGRLEFIWGDGTTTNFITSGSVVPFAGGQTGWVRATMTVANRVVSFYSSTDGITWTLISASSPTTATSIADGTSVVQIGCDVGGSGVIAGNLYYVEIRRGVDGPVVAAFDATKPTISAVRTPGTTTQAYNLLTANQASFESGTTGWAAAGGAPTIAQSFAQAADGTASLSVTSTAGPADMWVNTSVAVPVLANEQYSAVASVRANTTARNASVIINWYTSGMAFVSNSASSATADSNSAWTQIAVTGTAPGTAAFAFVTVYWNTVPIGEVHYTDKVALTQGSVTVWGPGATAYEAAGGTPWTLNGTNWNWSTAVTPYQGSRMLVANWKAGTFADRIVNPGWAPVEPNKTYTYMVHVNIPVATANLIRLAIAQFDATGTFIGGTDYRNTPTSSTTTAGWEKLSYSFVTHPNASNVELRVAHSVGGGNLAADDNPVYIDGLSFTEAPSNQMPTSDSNFEGLGVGWQINFNATLVHVEKRALRLPGLSGNYVSTPDSAPLSIVGDIDVRVKVAPDAWTTGGAFISKWPSSTNRSWTFIQSSTPGRPQFAWSSDGNTATGNVTASATAPYVAGQWLWYRVTLDVDNGASQNVVTFYYSIDGSTWVQLSQHTQAGVTTIFDGTQPVLLGGEGTGTSALWAGSIYYAEVRNGIDGTVAGFFDAAAAAPTTMRLPTSAVQGGTTWTLNGSSWVWTFANDGQRALAIQSTAASGVSIFQGISPATRPRVKPGQEYVFSLWMLSQTSRTVNVGIDWRDALGTVVSSSSTSFSSATTAWGAAQLKAIAPAGAVSPAMTLGIVSPAAGETHLLDSVDFATYEMPGPSIMPIISPTGIASGEAFGLLTTQYVVAPTGIPSGEAFGTAKLNLTLFMMGIPSGEAFGVQTIRLYVLPTGIPSAEAFGSTNVIQLIKPTAINSSEAFGTLQVNRNIKLTGIPSAEAFGSHNIGMIIFAPAGIASAEAFGNATLTRGPVFLYIPSISENEFGIPNVDERLDWWSSQYIYRIPVEVTAYDDVPAGHPVSVDISIFSQGKVLANYEDVEVLVYQEEKEPHWRRLGREITTVGESIIVRFLLDDPLAVAERETYYIHYGRPDATGEDRPVFVDNVWPIAIGVHDERLAFTRPTEHWDAGVSLAKNALATFEFTGPYVRVMSLVGPGWGTAEVQVDDGAWNEVDLYWFAESEMEVFRSGQLAFGTHKLRIRATGRAQPNARSTRINVTRVEYIAALVVDQSPEETLSNIPWAVVGGG